MKTEQATPEFADWYSARCQHATTDQGLDPIVDVIERAGIPVTVDQTGGFCMCVRVNVVEGGSQWLYLTANDGDVYAGDVVIGRYWDCSDTCDGWSDIPDNEYGIVPLSEVVDYVRAEIRTSPRPCPSCDPTGWAAHHGR